MIIFSGKSYSGPHNAIMLEPEDFNVECKVLAKQVRGHHVYTLLVPREYKDIFESTELYKMLLPNISICGIQFAKIYYYDADNGIALSDEGTCK